MFSNYSFKLLTRRSTHFVRHKHKPDHWSVLRKKIHPVDKALSHFDDFYHQVFGKEWFSIRNGLLGKQKYVAVVNNYSDSEETMENLEKAGALNVRTLFNLEKGYIRESKEKYQQKQTLNKIHEMDKEMEIRSETINEEDAKSGSDKYSLENKLKSAELDSRRLVDSRNELSSEILHEFIPATKIKGKEDFVPESNYYKYYDNTSQFTVNIEKEYDIHFPEFLNVYCFEKSNHTDFDPSKRGSTGVLNYYLMDGGSILPVLALDVKPGNTILDVCASPGGKSLLAIQTLYPDCIVSNDVSNSRVERIENVYRQFLYDFNEKWLKPGKIKVTNIDGRQIVEDNFDRILVDVPCTSDRHSLKENSNNIFKPSRIKERLKLPELQCQLLVNALKLVRIGGTVVYSTCSLSPIQNDGVIHMALKQIWEETKIEVVVKDLSEALQQSRSVFKFADQSLLKYGHLVVPYLPQNYGPTYFCKLQRIK